MTLSMLALLLLAAFSAGFVDSIAGGGGLLSVPALLFAGLPLHSVLGTNKGQSVFGAMASLLTYAKRGAVDKGRAPLSFAAAFLGALIGATVARRLDPFFLKPVVASLLLAVSVTLAIRPSLLFKARTADENELLPVSRPLVALAIGLGLGTYDGFFGPGTGTFLIIAYAHFFGDDPLHASANAKVANFASNFASVLVFAYAGQIVWKLALPMAAANMIGASMGSRLATKRGAPLIRWMVAGIAAATVLKVVVQALRGS